MNRSAENGAEASDRIKILHRLDPRSLGIHWKIRLNFFLRAIVAIGLPLLMINLSQRKLTLRDVNDKLLLLTQAKSKYIEDYFAHLAEQLSYFSAERQTIEAASQLSEAFLNIENDNYNTATVSGLDKVNILIEGFYNAEIIPLLETATNAGVNLQTLLPEDNKQRILQYLFLAGNSKPLGTKHTVNKSDDGSAYSYLHAQYHPEILKFARQAGISDILFVDYKTGYVTYSVQKNLDFGSNLYNGPYKNSGLGLAFKNAIGQPAGISVSFVDASLYVPAMYKPQIFISAPVYSESQLQGAVVFTLSVSALDGLLQLDTESLSSEEDLKCLLVGSDFLYRCNDPGFLADRATYIRRLRRNSGDGNTSSAAERIGTTALVQAVDGSAFAGALTGKAGLTSYSSETGEGVLSAYMPLRFSNLDWILIVQTDRSDAFASVRKFLLIMSCVALLIAGILYYMSGITSNAITRKLTRLKNNIIALSRGEKIQDSKSDSDDEIAQALRAVGKLSRRMEESIVFVNEIGKGNIEHVFAIENENDHFGISLNNLKKNLAIKKEEEEKRKKEDEIRNWSTQGIAMFNDILRSDNQDLERLTLNITRNIIQYLSANQGGLFLIEEEEGTKYLNLVASYAYDRQKFLKKKIHVGEGLAGSCVQEKKTVLLNRIPDNYIEITSGLGGSKPGCLMIVPLKKEEEVLGVLELASFNDFQPHEVEFVEKVSESIAASLITVRLHQQTSQYLEKFQQQAEEMKAQDEELRQNIEELQATHEQMERLKQEEAEHNRQMLKEIDDYRKLLISVINEIPEKIFVKDDKGRFIIANKLVADNYNRTVEEILGKSDFDFYPKEEAETYFKHEQEIINSGKVQVFEEGDPSINDGLIVRSVKKPIFIEHLGVTGLFGVQFDISDIKRKEYEATKLAEEIHEKQEELQKEKSLLDALLNNVPEQIYFKDKESRFIRFSHSMLKLFNLEKAEDLVGKSDFDFFSEEHAKPAFEDEQRIIRTGKAIIDLEEKEVMEDGRTNWVNTTKMPLRDSTGNIIGTFGISKNITNIKKLQEEAFEKNKELQAAEEELRQNLEEMQATQENMRRQMEENVRIQEELGKEKALMDALLHNIPEHIYFKDKDSKFIRFSHSMLKLFSLEKAEDLVGKSDFDFFSEEHARPAFEDEQRIIKTGKAIVDLEEKEVMEDGRFNWVNTTKMPLRNKKGEIIGTFGISKNITNIKKLQEEAVEKNKELQAAEEELRQNLEEMQATQENMRRQMEENMKMQEELGKEKALMDALLNNIPEHIYFKDKDSRFIRFSQSMLKLFSLEKAEDLIGKSDFDFFSEEHARPAFEDEQRIIKTGKAIIDLEEKEVMEDGRFNWVNTTKMPLRNKKGEIIGTFGISKNISRIKNLENEAREMLKSIEGNRKLLIDVLNKVPAKVFLKDENGVFVIVNQAVASIYNKTPEQVIGTSDYDNHPNEDVDSWRKQELEIIEKGETSYLHVEKVKGKSHYLNTTKMPFVLATTGKTGLLGIQFDVTDLKMLEEQVHKLKAEVEKLKK